MDLIAQFNSILPLACEWAETQEMQILQKGIPLPSRQLLDAKKIGVIHPDKVRILVIPTIPGPEDPLLKAACEQTNFLRSDTAGLTLRYGIYVRSDHANHYPLYAHELVHVTQYEKLCGIKGFLKKYLYELVTVGYASMSMEQEAINTAKTIYG